MTDYDEFELWELMTGLEMTGGMGNSMNANQSLTWKFPVQQDNIQMLRNQSIP